MRLFMADRFPQTDTAAFVLAFAAAPDIVLGAAQPPTAPGVYGFLFEGRLRYIGEAKGRGGLKDRIMSKHLSGDESHALQRTFQARFPDRLARRHFLKRSIHVKWLVVPSPMQPREIEERLIELHRPDWNLR